MSLKPIAAALLVACAFAATLEGALAIVDNPPLFTVRGHVTDIRAADFDADGKLDFAAQTWDGWSSEAAVVVFRGNGDGTFALPQRTVLPVTTDHIDVALLDGDAVPDLMIAGTNNSWATKLQMVRGNGDGTFAAPGAEISANWCEDGLELADMTSDGRADVVCGLTVLPNLGGGNFGSPVVASNVITSAYVVDANGDGRRDVVIREWPGTRIRLGYGNGTFGPEIPLPIDMDSRMAMAMANFDGSGWLDYAFIHETLSTGLGGAEGQYGAPTVRGFVEASSMETPDLNGDGRPDLVAGGSYQLSTWIMGAGGVPGPRTVYATAGSASVLATGDFDADGSVDVITGGGGDAFSNRGVISLFRGSASGALQGMRAYAVSGQNSSGYFGGTPNGAAVSDVTGDGKPDLVTVATAIPAILVYAGHGDGTFAGVPQSTALPYTSWPLPVYADLDGDGMTDVLVSDQYQFHCFMANGDGTYAQTTSFNASAGNHPGYGTGDFNGDGHQDFVSEYAGTLTFRAGNGDGTFDAPVAGQYGTSWDGFRIGDVNNDGKDDLVLDGDMLLGAADGVFTVVPRNAYGEPPAALTDLDGDGNLDLVQIDQHPDGSVTVEKGNGDGTFGPRRKMKFPQQQVGPRDLHVTSPGDFNGDGHMDVAFGATIFLGDGAGFFNGYARVRDAAAEAECFAADVDGSGTSDLVCAGADLLAVFRTHTAESLALPLSLEIESAPTTATAGEWIDVRVRATGPTAFAPTGAVLFSIGGNVAGTVELVEGVGNGRVHVGVVGTHPLTARFGGDDVYAAAETAPRQIEIARAPTQIDSWYWPQEPVTTQPIRFTGNVWSALQDPEGTISLFIDNVLTATSPAPSYDHTVGPLSLGSHSVRIEYSGNPTHLPTVRGFSVHVQKPLIAMGIAVDPPNGAAAGTPVTITVTFGDEPALTGSLTISGAGGVSFTVPISAGVATLTTSSLPPGQTITAWFPGNATYRATTKSIPYTITDAPIAPGPTSFYLIAPCRLLDTREVYWPIASADSRAVPVSRRCGIPYGAKAVAVNLTVVGPTNYGYLTLFPGANPLPSTSTLNYRPGKTRANSSVLPLSAGGALKVYNSGPASTHVIVDVTGYFE